MTVHGDDALAIHLRPEVMLVMYAWADSWCGHGADKGDATSFKLTKRMVVMPNIQNN